MRAYGSDEGEECALLTGIQILCTISLFGSLKHARTYTLWTFNFSFPIRNIFSHWKKKGEKIDGNMSLIWRQHQLYQQSEGKWANNWWTRDITLIVDRRQLVHILFTFHVWIYWFLQIYYKFDIVGNTVFAFRLQLSIFMLHKSRACRQMDLSALT